MASDKKKEASRRNGARSQGPRTAEGKKRSSRNSERHGLLAKTVVLDGENKDVFMALIANLDDQYQPCDQTEHDLLETMAIARWRVMRLWAMEKAMLMEEIKKDTVPGRDHPTRAAAAFRTLCDQSNAASLLGRYETRYDRQYCRALNLLLKKRSSAPDSGTNSPCESNLPNEPTAPQDPWPLELPERHPDGASLTFNESHEQQSFQTSA